MSVSKQTFNTIDVLYDNKKWGKRIDPNEWNSNFKVVEKGHNDLVGKLTQQTTDICDAIDNITVDGGSNINVIYSGANSTLQDSLDNIVNNINNRYTKSETDANIATNVNSLVKSITYNSSTGVFTITKKDDTVITIDTVIEKVPASMALQEESDGSVYLVITNQDGSSTKTNVTSLIEDTIILSSDTINAASTTDGVNKTTTYTLNIKPNSVTLSHLDTELTTKFEETQTAMTLALQAKDNAVAAKVAAENSENNAEIYASNANSSAVDSATSADEAAASALEAKGYADQASSYKSSAELAKIAAEKARDEAQEIAGGDFATKNYVNEAVDGLSNHILVTITSGRMRGDIDGDGKFTQNDIDTLTKHVNGEEILTDSTQLLSCDVNSDGKVNGTDTNACYRLVAGTIKAGQYTEVTGNWTSNPNYATEDGQFYTDISIDGMSTASSASVLVQGEYELGFFVKAECIEGALRIYAKRCPIKSTNAIVSWGTGDGTATITAENYVPEGEVFIATYDVTTSAELKKARDDGKVIFVKSGSLCLPFTVSLGSRFVFTGFQNSVKGVFISCLNDTWSSENIYALPAVTADDTGKSLMVNSSGSWVKTLPADARTNLGFTYGTEEPTGTPSTGAGSVYFMEDDGSPLPISEGGTGANTKMGVKQSFLIGATAVPSFYTKDLADSEVTLIPLANFDVKTDSEFQIGGNGGIVMPYSGTVLVSGGLYIVTTTSTAPAGVFIQIIHNGAAFSVCSNYSVSRGGMTAGTKLINVEAGDILCIYGRGYGSTAKVYATTVEDSFLSVFYV